MEKSTEESTMRKWVWRKQEQEQEQEEAVVEMKFLQIELFCIMEFLKTDRKESNVHFDHNSFFLFLICFLCLGENIRKI